MLKRSHAHIQSSFTTSVLGLVSLSPTASFIRATHKPTQWISQSNFHSDLCTGLIHMIKSCIHTSEPVCHTIIIPVGRNVLDLTSFSLFSSLYSAYPFVLGLFFPLLLYLTLRPKGLSVDWTIHSFRERERKRERTYRGALFCFSCFMKCSEIYNTPVTLACSKPVFGFDSNSGSAHWFIIPIAKLLETKNVIMQLVTVHKICC